MPIVNINTSINTNKGGTTGTGSRMANHCCILGKKDVKQTIKPTLTDYAGRPSHTEDKWCGVGGAIGQEKIEGDACFDFDIQNQRMMVGFTSDCNTSTSWTRLDFAVYFWNGQVRVYGRANATTGSGAYQGTVGSYTAGDSFSMKIEGNAVKLYKGTTLLHTFTNQTGGLKFPLYPAYYSFDAGGCITDPLLTI